MIAIPLAIIYKFGNDFKKLSYYAIFLLVFTAIFGLPTYFAYKILKCLIFIFSLYGGYTHYKYESKITAIAYTLIALLFIGNFGFTRSDWEAIDFFVAISFYVGSWWYDKYLVVKSSRYRFFGRSSRCRNRNHLLWFERRHRIGITPSHTGWKNVYHWCISTVQFWCDA